MSVADCLPLSSALKTVKINGGIQCMRCVKHSRLSTSIRSVYVTAGSNVPSTLGRCAVRRRAIHKCRSAVHASVDLAFITDDDDDAKNAKKMQHIFAYNELPGGGELPRRDLTLVESSRRADVQL